MKKVSLLAILTLCAVCLITSGCSAQKNKSPNHSTTQENSNIHIPSPKEIEITLENWDTYFEFIEKEEEYKNEYNETEHIMHYYALVLKDDYVMSETGTDIAVEYSYLDTRYKVKEDLINKRIEWVEYIEDSDDDVVEEIKIKHAETGVAGEVFGVVGNFKSKCSDFKVLRIYGTLSILE